MPSGKYITSKPRGFAAISRERRREIASQGGVALSRARGHDYMSKMGQRGGRLSAGSAKRKEWLARKAREMGYKVVI